MSGKLKIKATPRNIGIGLFALAVVILLVGWFGVVSPKRSDTGKLQAEIDTTQQSIDSARAALLRSRQQLQQQQQQHSQVDFPDFFRFARAMPDQPDIPGAMLELNQLATSAGVTFRSITPGQAAPVSGGYSSIPLAIVVDGNYYSVSDFLYRLRSLVLVRDNQLSSQGRLFTVDSISLAQGDNPFPAVRVNLALNTFVYDPAAATTPGTGTSATGTPSATTPSATTPTTPPATTPSSSTSTPPPASAPPAPSTTAGAPPAPAQSSGPTSVPNSGGTAAGATN